MDFLTFAWKEISQYLRLSRLSKMMSTDDYAWLGTFEGILAIVGPVLTIVFIMEIVLAIRRKTFHRKNFLPQFLTYVTNTVFNRALAVGSYPLWIGKFDHLRPFESSVTWYWFIYGFLVFDLALYILHWLMHKVRILWCIHAQHHATEALNTSVNNTNFVATAVFLSFFKTIFCMALGVNPAILLMVAAIDGLWVTFSHVSTDVFKSGRMGWLDHLLISPSLHRVHHARNALYIDTNYSNFFTVWDRVFGTFQKEDPREAVEFGITRPVNFDNFFDFYFGDFVLLWRDVVAAPTLKAKFLYLVMPPGWHHSGEHKMAKQVRQEYLDGVQPPRAAAPGAATPAEAEPVSLK